MFGGFPRPVPDSKSAGFIKNVQFGTSTIASSASSVNTAVSQVDTSKSIVLTGFYQATTNALGEYVSGTILNSTTLSFGRSTTGAYTTTIKWQLIEFTNVKSIQSGQINLASGVSNISATISNVNTSKAFIYFTWSITSGGDAFTMVAEFTASNTVKFTRTIGSAGAYNGGANINYFVVESV